MRSLTDKPILVTGATGFLGGRLAELLATRENAKVTGIGRNLKRNEHLQRSGVTMQALDLLDTDALQRVLEGQEVLFHAAALLDTDPKMAYEVNVGATENLTRLAAQAGVKRMVHVSTVGVYDMKDRDVVGEDTPLAVNHPATYPRTKALAEVHARRMADMHKLELAIVRPSMIYGPGHGIWSAGMFKNVLGGKPTFLGDGGYQFNPVYVDDVIDAMIRCAIQEEAAGEAFNVSAEVTTWLAFMEYYGRLSNKKPKGLPVLIARLLALANKIPGIRTPIDEGFIEMATSNKVFPTEKARQILDWAPVTSLEEGMQITTAWLRKEVYTA